MLGNSRVSPIISILGVAETVDDANGTHTDKKDIVKLQRDLGYLSATGVIIGYIIGLGNTSVA